MLRSEIPGGLLVRRQADINRIPSRVLTAIKTTDELARRLLAADEFRRRARVPHLDPDLYRHRIGLASEVLTTADPKRAAQLVKAASMTTAAPGATAAAAGTLPGQPRPLPGQLPLQATVHAAGHGEHQHQIAACGHVHVHEHRGDNDHTQVRAHVAVTSANKPLPGNASAKSVQPGTLRKDTAQPVPGDPDQYGISTGDNRVLVSAPVCKAIGLPAAVLGHLVSEGRLGEMQRELGAIAKAVSRTGGGKAGAYRRKAAVVSDPELRKSYLELAEQLETAGAR